MCSRNMPITKAATDYSQTMLSHSSSEIFLANLYRAVIVGRPNVQIARRLYVGQELLVRLRMGH
jgi:hypothetical protein